MVKPSILVVDDDAFFRTFCAEVLRREGYAVLPVASGREALETLDRGEASLVLADIYMPEMSGLELLESVKARHPSVDVVIMTGYASIDTAIQALKRGARDYLRKPFAAEELAVVIDSTLAQRRLYQENARLKQQLGLYELSRSFASLEDPFRVLALGLEALCRATSAQAGMCLHSGSDLHFMALRHHRGMEPADAEALREGFLARGLRYLRGVEQPQVIGRTRLSRIVEGTTAAGFREALLVPLRRRGGMEALFALFHGGAENRFTAEDQESAHFLGAQVEISYEGSQGLHEARQLAFVDSLTDLYNGRYLDTALDSNITEADRMRTPFSLLFLDLDYFKEINDAYGHLTGGKVLIEVSRILRNNVREGDVVIRYGGDEFTVVLPRTDAREAREVAERIRCAIKEHVFLGREGGTVHLTVSIGVATYPDNAKTREELLDQADRAMYRGKEAARDTVYAAHSH
ncbi:MAG: diguanylate cyclase [Proteobacteria bacterium]|nr:diguanylate cyclase [Pseudomonadota bacterium]